MTLLPFLGIYAVFAARDGAVDGRTWSSVDSLDYEGSRTMPSSCPAKPGEGAPRSEFVYLISENAAASLAGLVSDTLGYRGTSPYPVLTPPG